MSDFSAPLVFKYILFAVISTIANIGAQWLTVNAIRGNRFDVVFSMLVGTILGLLVKYVLDKKWIFSFRSRGHAHEVHTFMLYSLMGVLTTGIFWITELAFEHIFATDGMRYLGGVIGLGFGYTVKYLLDRKYVFRKSV